jgi:hypothetical protein
MISAFFPIFASAIMFLLYLAIAAALIRKYKNTGDMGFLWLGLAVVLWPLVSNLIFGWGGHILMQHFMNSHPAKHPASGTGPASGGNLQIALDLVQKAIGLVLLLIAVRILSPKESNLPTATKGAASTVRST